MSSSCSTKTVSLPVLGHESPGGRPPRASNAWQGNHAKIKHSRAGRWRALVLILVHIAIAIHIAIWYFGDRAVVSPVEPSESMQTIREGVINAGFIFFALAILSTLVLGRWFCGWGCHIVAVQDLCSWMMMKVGVKPKPFRSRLLMWFPLLLAIYMFIWPALHRELIRPLVMDARGRLPWWLGQSDPIPGITTELLVHDFWATFAPWYVAIPFILVCTFGAVYFLGSKGFCTYGCPYGGFFAPADRLAVGRIRVTDACEHCGHCTAVCTSNVRVHEEVRDFGMVVDPGCMKCMDCVSVCPNQALYFGVGRPAALARPRTADARETRAQARALRAARFDLTGPQEIVLFLLFLAYFWAYRGFLNQVPMLMAVGMALVVTFCTWKLWQMRPIRLGGVPNIRLQSLQLRYRGRARPAGYALVILTIAGIAVAAWSAAIKAQRWEADRLYAKLETPLEMALRPEFQATSAEASIANRAIELFERSGPRSRPSHGGLRGWGWALTPDEELNVAYMNVLLGRLPEARASMERVIRDGHPTDSLISQAAALLRADLPTSRRATQEELQAFDIKIRALYEQALALHPDLDGARSFLIGQKLQKIRAAAPRPPLPPISPSEAADLRSQWTSALAERHPRTSALLEAARLELALSDPAKPAEGLAAARAFIHRAIATLKPHEVDKRLAIAGLLTPMAGAPGNPQADADRAQARELIESASSIGRRTGATALAAAGAMIPLGDAASAKSLVDLGLSRARTIGPHNGQLRSLITAANLKLQLQNPGDALPLFREAGELVNRAHVSRGGYSGGAWELHGLGLQLLGFGFSRENGAFIVEGVKQLEAAAAFAPDSPVILNDLAQAYYQLDRHVDAERVLTQAATLADRSVALARTLSSRLAERGKVSESIEWEQKAKQREALAKP